MASVSAAPATGIGAAPATGALTRAGALTLAAAALLLAAYAPEVEAAVATWARSTAYGHCFLVLPVAAWLAWERRDALAQAGIRPARWAWLAALPLAAAWFAFERLGVMEARQFVLLAMVWVLAIAGLGARGTRAIALPLLYLVFLVPFGAFLVPALQGVTASFVDAGLTALEVPHVVSGTVIEIPEGRFLVAEACAGLRFLIASVAFGALYAAVIYRSTARRLLFLAAAIVVPVAANGVRALGIVMIGHARGSAEAGAADHVIYGWVFFSVVILLLILLGLPFREDGVLPTRPPPRADAPRHVASVTSVAIALGLALAAASSGRAAGLLVDATADAPAAIAARPVLIGAGAPPPGCALAPASDDPVATIACDGATLTVAIECLSPRSGTVPVLEVLRRSDPLPVMDAAGDIEDVRIATVRIGGAAWRRASIARPLQVAAGSVFIGGHGCGPGLATRLALARAGVLSGGRPRPVVVARVVATGDRAEAAEARILAWLTGPIARLRPS